MDEELVAEIRRHFDVVAEGLVTRIQQVAAGVLGVDEKLGAVHGAIDSELGEIKSMVKLSFAELDRRVNGPEKVVSSLASRVESLEASVSPGE